MDAWRVGVGDMGAGLCSDGAETILNVGDQTIRIPAAVAEAVMLLHSLCHVAMDHPATAAAASPVDAHSSCHDRVE